MITFPNAKINLGLRVLSKREDGYHNIESIFYPIAITDVLEIVKSEEDYIQFSSSGLPISGDPKLNLCVRAYEIIKEEHGIGGVLCHLHKSIPMGAGLGGGSADGVFMLKALDALFSLQLSNLQLSSYAEKLGSDCPFFLYNRAALVSGRGETVEAFDIDLKGKQCMIIHPRIHVSTAEAYAGIALSNQAEDGKWVNANQKDWKETFVNDFEKTVFKLHPIIEELKNSLYENGAMYAQMSGSGSAVYGIFENPIPTLDLPENFDSWDGCSLITWVQSDKSRVQTRRK